MQDELRFYLERDGRAVGPVADDELRDALRTGEISGATRLRLAGTELELPAESWATFGFRGRPDGLAAPSPREVLRGLPETLRGAPIGVRDLLLWVVAERGAVFGPIVGDRLRRELAEGKHATAVVSVLHMDAWIPAALAFAEATKAEREQERDARAASVVEAEAGAWRAQATSTPDDGRCPYCLERVGVVSVCPECGEGLGAPTSARADAPSRPPSIPDDPPDASWLRMHWRPLVTLGAVWALITTGIVLRHVAPDRFTQTRAASGQSAVQSSGCSEACWPGESCQLGVCAWQTPNGVGHVGGKLGPDVKGPFPLPKDVTDVLPLDRDRFLVGVLTGCEVRRAQTAELVATVTETPFVKQLVRVGDVVYVASPERIHVLDPETTRVLKTVETGVQAGQIRVGASGRRVLVTLPSAHAVGVIATEYHAEIDRIQFGDDQVLPVGLDDSGRRALTTTGQVPLAGYRDPAGGALYLFDPSRLASQQDRVRSAMLGNPVGVTFIPDDATAYVVLRAEDAIVPLTLLASGGARQEGRIATCREPEQLELVRRGRRALVRCNEGRSVAVLELGSSKPSEGGATPRAPKQLRQLSFRSRVTDLVVTPDERQALVALPEDEGGAVAIVDLETLESRVISLPLEPTRIRLSPDGSTAVVLSDRTKMAWVLQ